MTEKAKLKKSITWLQGSAMATGSVIGAGILALPAVAAVEAGPASLVSWALMGVVALPMLAAIAEMSSRYPDSGGIAAYAKQAFGPEAGRLTGFLILFALPVVMPTTLLIGANYMGGVFGWSSGAVHAFAAAMALATVALNLRGIDVSGRAQVLIVSAIVGMLLFVIFSAAPYVKTVELRPFAPNGMGAAMRVTPILFFAFIGWEMIGHLAEEFRDPKKDIPLSLGIAYVVDNAVYIAVAFVIVATGVYKAGNPNVAMMTLVGWRWGGAAAVVIGALGCVVCFCPIMTSVAGWSRLAYSLSRDGCLPEFLGRLHPKWSTPCNALLTLAPVLLGVIFVSWAASLDLRPLLGLPGSAFLFAYVIGLFSAAKVLTSRWGKRAGVCGGLLSFAVFAMSGAYALFPLAVTAFFLIRVKTRTIC